MQKDRFRGNHSNDTKKGASRQRTCRLRLEPLQLLAPHPLLLPPDRGDVLRADLALQDGGRTGQRPVLPSSPLPSSPRSPRSPLPFMAPIEEEARLAVLGDDPDLAADEGLCSPRDLREVDQVARRVGEHREEKIAPVSRAKAAFAEARRTRLAGGRGGGGGGSAEVGGHGGFARGHGCW